MTADTEMSNPTGEADDEEATLCDLHFIANCQSCSKWDDPENGEAEDPDDEGKEWLSHSLSFQRTDWERLDLERKNEEELVVIDPREKAKEYRPRKREIEIKARGRRGDGEKCVLKHSAILNSLHHARGSIS